MAYWMQATAILLALACFPWLAAQAQTPMTQSVSIAVNHEILPLGATDPNGTLKFALTRSGAITDALEVNINLTQEWTWLSSSRLTQSVTFAAGVAEASFELTRSWFWEDNSDTLGNGYLTATIASGESYSVSGEPALVFIIGRREPLGLIILDMAEYAFTEETAGQTINVVATLASGISPSALKDWFVSVGSFAGDTQNPNASSPEDFAAISEMVRIEADDYHLEGIRQIARVPVQIDVIDDEIYEPEERFKLKLEISPGFETSVFRLCKPSGTTFSCIGPSQDYPATIAASDQPEQPFVSLDRGTLLETDNPDTNADETRASMTAGFKGGGVFGDNQTITLAFGGSAEPDADYTVTPIDADFDHTNGHQLTLPAGSRTVAVTFAAVADSVASEAEELTITATLDINGTPIIDGCPMGTTDGCPIGAATIKIFEDVATSSDDATLRNLRLTSRGDSIPLNGGFNRYHTSYTAVADRISDQVLVEAEVNSPYATVAIANDDDPSSPGSARLDLEIGVNLIEVTVTAGNGDTSTYEVRLTRLANLPVVTIEPINAEVEEGEPVRYYLRLAQRWPTTVYVEVRGLESGARTLLDPNPLFRWSILGGRDPVKTLELRIYDDDWPEGEGTVTAQIWPSPGYYEIGDSGKATVRILDDDGDTMRKPDVPQRFEAIPDNAQVTLAWDAPLSDGGSPITHYEYRVDHPFYSIQPGETGGEWVSTGSADTVLVLMGLANTSKAYQFGLRAVNSKGASLPLQVYGRPISRPSKPGAPRNLIAEADSSGGIVMSWDTPAADGGAPLTRYDYIVQEFYSSDNSYSGAWVSTGSTETQFTVTQWLGRPLNSQLSYQLRVRAANTEGSGKFSNGVWAAPANTGGAMTQTSAVMYEPLVLSIAAASVQEAPGAELEFELSLDRPALEQVTVAYATADGTATAGEDYTTASGALVFSPGEQTRTLRVSVLDDAHDEGAETLTLTLSDAQGAMLENPAAIGTIRNSDPMPKAWLARFGRAAADHAAQAISRRLERGPQDSHLTLGGMRMNDLFKPVQSEVPTSAAPALNLPASPLNSSFYYSNDGAADGAVQWASWGETAASRFQGADGPLSLNGEVVSAIMGLDGGRGRWLAGVAVSYSHGEGAYTHRSAAGGDVSSSLTSINPYAHYQLDERTSLWGALGHGTGELVLKPDKSSSALAAGLTNTMAAFGGRSRLTARSATPNGFVLAIRSDVLLTETRSDSLANLAGVAASTSRARLLLEGSGSLPLAHGALRPTLEAGLRYDAGDAEQGTGFEIGGGLAYESGRLSMQVDARALVAHQADNYREWGLSASLNYRPGADGRGLGLRLGSAWGPTASGIQNLWAMQDANSLTSGGPIQGRRRLELELGYGVGQGWLWYPYLAADHAGRGEQALRMGLKLNAGPMMEAGLEIGRRDTGFGTTRDAVLLQGRIRW